MYNLSVILAIFLLGMSGVLSLEDGNAINDLDSPRVLIGSGKAITRNTRQISDLRTVSMVNSIHVYWNFIPATSDGFPCCPFTLLEIYPLNSMGRKIPGESIVLLKPNVTEYVVNNSHITPNMNIDKYMICVRLWHRFGGKERKLDESCIQANIVFLKDTPNVVLIVFASTLSLNAVLIGGLIVVKVIKLRRRSRRNIFTVRKWWKDMSDILQQQASRSSLESRMTTVNIDTPERRPSGISGSLNNALSASVPGSPSVRSLHEPGRLVNTISTGTVGNEYNCLNNQVYDLFLNHPYHNVRRSSNNQIYLVCNGPSTDPANVAVI